MPDATPSIVKTPIHGKCGPMGVCKGIATNLFWATQESGQKRACQMTRRHFSALNSSRMLTVSPPFEYAVLSIQESSRRQGTSCMDRVSGRSVRQVFIGQPRRSQTSGSLLLSEIIETPELMIGVMPPQK